MATARPMLGDLELQQVQEIATDGDQVFARHRVPALEGDFLQGLGRRGGRISVCGVVSGEGVEERLDGLRRSFRGAAPVTFVSDIAAATEVGEVLIEELEVRELAGKPKRFEYRLLLREYTEPEPVATEDPPEIPPPELPEESTLIVEVIVEGDPGFDLERVTVSARGTTDAGDSLSRQLTDRSGAFWTGEDFEPGSYTAEAAVANDPQLRGSEPAVVRAGETTQVTITLRRGAVVAEAHIIHFRFDSAFIEPCFRPVLREIARRAAANPQEKLLLVGHTDLVGGPDYNQSLSERRARAVYAYLIFGRDPGTAIAEWNTLRQPRPNGELPSLKDTWGTFQVQHMLQDVGHYVGNIDERESPELTAAIRALQGDHGVPQTGVMDDDTWPVLIERYLAVDPQSVAEAKFLPNRGEECESGVVKWLGCGEQDPVRNTQDAWRPNRRAEALFVAAAELPCRVAQPVTFALGAAGARNARWCLGPGNANKRCCFLARDREAQGKWLVRPARPERLTVRGRIRFEDGTPVRFAKYALIAPDGEFLHTNEAGKADLGERPSGPDRGRAIPDRADADGVFTYPKPTPVGGYILELLELERPQVARATDQAPHQARGNVVCIDFEDAAPAIEVEGA